MSIKAIVSALVALVLLSGLAFILIRPSAVAPGASATPTPLLQFDAAQLNSIEVVKAGGAGQRVTRNAAGEWSYVWALGGGRTINWSAMVPAPVMQAIGALNGLARTDDGSAPAELEAPEATLRLGFADGTTQSLQILPGSLGGFTLVVGAEGAAGGVGRAPTTSIQEILSGGPASWRIATAAPGIRDASRITIKDAKDEIALAKLDSKWTMRRPISARALQGAVDSLLVALAAAPVTRFEDAGDVDRAATGLEAPILSVTWEVDQRDVGASGDVRVRSQMGVLRVGGPADATGTLRYATADEQHSTLLVIPASVVSSVSTAARNYLATTITSVQPQDVFLLTLSAGGETPGSIIGVRALRRDVGQWATQMPDGSKQPADGAAVEELLEFLATRPGEAEPAKGEADLREVVRIDLFDLDGDPLEVISGGYTADGTLAFRVKNLIVMFGGVEAPGILNMPAYASLAPPPDAPPPVTMPDGAPVGK